MARILDVDWEGSFLISAVRKTILSQKTKGLTARGGSIDPWHGGQHKSSRRIAIEQVFVEISCFDRAAADFVMVIELT